MITVHSAPRLRNRTISAWLSSTLFAIAYIAAANSFGSECASCKIRPCDQLWLVSTRAFPCGDPKLHVDSLTYQICDEACVWQPSDLASFLKTDDPSVTTVIWVHGNRYSANEAHRLGMATYRVLAQSPGSTQPLRFVIFSWPSDQIAGGPIADIREKAERSSPNAYYLAWLVDHIAGDVPISLIGYSYGSRIASGALHLLGGGTLDCRSLDKRLHPERQPMHVILAAAAFDNDWWMPGRRHGMALSQVKSVVLFNNSCDSVLRRYHFLYCLRSDAEALGYTGVAGMNRIGSNAAKITQIDTCCEIGRSHSWEDYLRLSSIAARMKAEVFSHAPIAVEADRVSAKPLNLKNAKGGT